MKKVNSLLLLLALLVSVSTQAQASETLSQTKQANIAMTYTSFSRYYAEAIEAYETLTGQPIDKLEIVRTEKSSSNTFDEGWIEIESGDDVFKLSALLLEDELFLDEVMVWFQLNEGMAIDQEKTFPYLYIVASCFVDGCTAEERLNHAMASLDIVNTYHLDSNYNGENFSEYIGTYYNIFTFANGAPYQIIVFPKMDYKQMALEN